MKIRVNRTVKVGRVVKYFVLADLVLLAGWGLVEPVFSIFVVSRVAGATFVTVGISAALYWLLRSLVQIPVATYLDRHPGETDDFRAIILSLALAAGSALSFLAVRVPWQLYLAQVLHAVAFGMYIPAWSAIFSRHLDRDRIAFDWSLDSMAVGIGMGFSGLAGGVVAQWFGFEAIFIAAAVLSAAAAAMLFMAPELILPGKPRSREPLVKDHTPRVLGQ
jgi:MFS family permease